MDSARGNSAGLDTASFEALRPRRTVWSVILIGLLALVVGGTVWAVPSLVRVRLDVPPPVSVSAIVPMNTPLYMIFTPLQGDVLGGVTVTGIDPVGNARLAGAWLLDDAQQQELWYATFAWNLACYDSNNPDETVPACRLPVDDSQADAFVAALVRRGAPLDASTALPRHLGNRQPGLLVGLWVASECHESDDRITLRVSRFGIRGTSSFRLYFWPGCGW